MEVDMSRVGVTAIACVTLSLSGMENVQAQTSGALPLEEITVTARKREESLQDTPISISAFTSAALEHRGISDLSQIGSYTSNMEFDFTAPIAANSNTAAIYIRGIGELDWVLSVDPGVGLYLDDVYISRSIGAVLDVMEVERIEVLKGPQGTLFGRNTIGGAISITSKKPHAEKEARATLTTGSDDRLDAKLYVNQPLSDNLFFNGTVARRSRDGYVKNLAPGAPDLGDDDVWAGRVSLRWTPADNLDFTLSGDRTREREAPGPNVLLAADETALEPSIYHGAFPGTVRFDPPASAVCLDTTNPARLSDPTCFNSQWVVGPFQTYSTHETTNPAVNAATGRPASPEADLDLWGISFTAEWDINEYLTFKSTTSYRDLKGFWTRDLDHSPLSVYALPNVYEQDQFTQEVQLQGTAFDERLNWILGIYYFEEEGSHVDIFEGPAFSLFTGGSVKNDSIAVFGQGTYDITEKLSLTLGSRWTEDNKSFTPNAYVLQDTFFGFPVGTRVLPATEASVSATEVVPYFNLAYRWTEDLMTYATYTEGFKSGGFTQRVFPPLPETPSFEPEFVDSYEIGIKSTWMENRLRLNGAIFYTDYSDLQVNVVEGVVGAIIRRNAAKADITGFELEMNLVPDEHWLIDASVGYLDAQYKRFDASAIAAGLSEDFEFINTPEWTASIGASYRYQLTDTWTMAPRVDWSYRSRVYNDAVNSPIISQEGYSLLHAGIRFETTDEKWAVTMRGTNLTDETYLVTGVSAANDGFLGFAEGVYGRPREWELTVSYQFY